MPQPPLPTVPMVTSEFTTEEVESVIAKSKSASSPSPVDQILYTHHEKVSTLDASPTAHIQPLLVNTGSATSLEG